MELFDYLNNITTTKQSLSEEELKGYSPYMINRFVSMCDMFIPLVTEINKYDLPKEVHHIFMQASLPKRKQYFKYIKSKKETQQKEIECLCEYFEIGKKEALRYLDILSNDQIDYIVGMYKTR